MSWGYHDWDELTVFRILRHIFPGQKFSVVIKHAESSDCISYSISTVIRSETIHNQYYNKLAYDIGNCFHKYILNYLLFCKLYWCMKYNVHYITLHKLNKHIKNLDAKAADISERNVAGKIMTRKKWRFLNIALYFFRSEFFWPSFNLP